MSGPGRARETSHETPETRQTPRPRVPAGPDCRIAPRCFHIGLHGAEAPPIPGNQLTERGDALRTVTTPVVQDDDRTSVAFWQPGPDDRADTRAWPSPGCPSRRRRHDHEYAQEDPVRARCIALCLLAHGSGLWVLGLIGMRWFAGRPGITAATARRSSVRVSRLDRALRPGDRRGRRSLSLCGRRALYRTASWVSRRFGGQRGRCRLSLSRCRRWIRNITGDRGGTRRVNRSGIDGQGGLRLTSVECRRIQSTQSGKGNVRSQCEGDRCAEGNSKHHNGPAHPHQDGPASPGLVFEDGLGHRHGLTVPRNCPRPDTRPKSC